MASIYFIFEFFIKSYVFLMSVQVGWACDPNIGLSNSYLVEYFAFEFNTGIDRF
jgi:hypothetical protein